MPTEKTLRSRLARMGDARRDSLYRLTRREVALNLLDERGEVTAADIDDHMAQTYVVPDQATIDNMLAAKTTSGVEFLRRELDVARGDVAGLETSRDRAAERLENAGANLDRQRDYIAELEGRLADAEALAEFANGVGDATAAPVGDSVQAAAQAADTTGG